MMIKEKEELSQKKFFLHKFLFCELLSFKITWLIAAWKTFVSKMILRIICELKERKYFTAELISYFQM